MISGISALGETLSGAKSANGLVKLNYMVDMWAADRLAIFRRQRVSGLNLVSGTQSYTVGTGATWNVARPSFIDGAGIIVDPSATYPVELEVEVLTLRQYQQRVVKTVQSGLPRAIWYDHTNPSTNYGTVYVYPVPDTSTPDMVLYLPIAVTEFSALGTTLALPPSYRMAMIANLAVLLCMGLRDVPADVQSIAIRSYGLLKSVNLVEQMDPLECEEAVLPQQSGTFNYWSGNIR